MVFRGSYWFVLFNLLTHNCQLLFFLKQSLWSMTTNLEFLDIFKFGSSEDGGNLMLRCPSDLSSRVTVRQELSLVNKKYQNLRGRLPANLLNQFMFLCFPEMTLFHGYFCSSDTRSQRDKFFPVRQGCTLSLLHLFYFFHWSNQFIYKSKST